MTLLAPCSPPPLSTALNGWIILDKPKGMTSTKVGSLVKRILGVKKIGHAGTLDPFATGVLPLAIGEATKTMPYVMGTQKKYQFQITWGEETDTQDLEGTITAASSHRPTKADIESILPRFTGFVDQIPPDYSAVKVKGERAYTLARQGQSLCLPKRTVSIEKIALLSMDSPQHATFEVTCGPGTYVRSLGQDMARSLGTVGHLSQLRRTKVGKFTEKTIISLEKFEEIVHNSNRQSVLVSIGAVLDDIPAVSVSQDSKKRIYQGQPISGGHPLEDGAMVTVLFDSIVIAIGFYKQGLIYPKRVFNYT